MKLSLPSRTTLLVALLALTAAAYIQSLSHLFVLDDHDLLERIVATLHSPFDAWSVGSAFQSYYRPVFLTSLWIDNALFGDTATGFHVVNLLLHLGATWAAFVLAERLFNNRLLAVLAAAMFALHPAHTENVSWVSGRTDVLCALFVFLSLIEFHKLLVRPSPAAMWRSGLYFFLALGSKEVGIIVPVLCALMYMVRGSIVVTTPAPEAPRPNRTGKGARRRTAMEEAKPSAGRYRLYVFALYAVSVAIFLIARSAASSGAVVENVFLTRAEVLQNAARCFAMYLWHAAFGGGYEYIILGWRVAAPEWNLGLPLASGTWIAIWSTLGVYVVALTIAIIRRRGVAVIGLIGFLVSILPALGFIPIISIFSVRFLYLPSFFFVIAVIDIVHGLIDRPSLSFAKLPAIAIGAAIAVFWGVSTFQQDAHWHDDLTLLESMRARVSDSPVYYFCRGNGHRYRGEFMEAAKDFDRAARHYPEYYDAYVNLGASLSVLGDSHPEYYVQAIDVYQRAIKAFPRRAQLYMYLGDAYVRSGQEGAASQKYVEGYNIQKLPELRARLRQMGVSVE